MENTLLASGVYQRGSNVNLLFFHIDFLVRNNSLVSPPPEMAPEYIKTEGVATSPCLQQTYRYRPLIRLVRIGTRLEYTVDQDQV